MTQSALALAQPDEPIEYPESDGEPIAETDIHRDELLEMTLTLERHFRAREDVYVSGNLFFYYEEGNPRACKAPDVFVVTGVAKKKRRTYKLWEEGEVPALVIEVTSKKTKREDEVDKPELYAELGIPYLFVYDPCAEYLKPPLKGFELGKDGAYRRIPGRKNGPFPCPPLGLALFLDERGRLKRTAGPRSSDGTWRPRTLTDTTPTGGANRRTTRNTRPTSTRPRDSRDSRRAADPKGTAPVPAFARPAPARPAEPCPPAAVSRDRLPAGFPSPCRRPSPARRRNRPPAGRWRCRPP
jgi:Uma2 family endonuclease